MRKTKSAKFSRTKTELYFIGFNWRLLLSNWSFLFFFFRFCLPLYMHKNSIISGSGDILKLILKLHAQNANHLSRVTWNVATRFIHTYNSKHTCSGKKINMILVYFLLLVLSWCIFLLSMSGQYLPHKNYLEYH